MSIETHEIAPIPRQLPAPAISTSVGADVGFRCLDLNQPFPSRMSPPDDGGNKQRADETRHAGHCKLQCPVFRDKYQGHHEDVPQLADEPRCKEFHGVPQES